MKLGKDISLYLTDEQIAALKKVNLRDLFPHDTVYLQPTFLGEMASYKKEPFNVLETDPEFSERVSFIKTFLNSQAKIHFQWIINRAYFSGYANNKKDEENGD